MKGRVRGRALTALHAKGLVQGTSSPDMEMGHTHLLSKHSWEAATFLEMFQIPTKTSEYGS